MPDISQHIQTALCQRNFNEALLSRLSACLSVHAVVCRASIIPRVYVTKKNYTSEDDEWAWNALDTCLRIDHKAVRDITKISLKVLGLSTKGLDRLDPERQQEILELVESIIQDGWGEGYVCYDEARFTPFTSSDVSHLSLYCGPPDNPEKEFLTQRLHQRSISKVKYNQQYAYMLRHLERSHGSDTYASVLKDKVDAQWQYSWLSHLRYISEGWNSVGSIILPGGTDA